MIALDGKTYDITSEMCVIADADGQRPIGLGGVMGGESTGCSNETTDVFIESSAGPERAEFNRIRKEQGLKAALAWRDARFK